MTFVTASTRVRVDTMAVKTAHPIADIAARYTELRRSGRALVGRCPLHDDRRNPNFYVYEATASFYCYRCNLGGDVIRLVELAEHLDFRGALARLGTPEYSAPAHPRLQSPRSRRVRPRRQHDRHERAVLAAAAELYSNCLLTDPEALTYVRARGLSRATVEHELVGYCAGDALINYLIWRQLPLAAAFRVGLLREDPDGSPCEVFAGRIVVPEVRRGCPVWMIGRTWKDQHPDEQPKYLGLPGPKPLFGWAWANRCQSVVIVEGLFDYLTLRMWGVPVIALLGTHVPADAIGALRKFPRQYVCLDADDAGRAATGRLLTQLGSSAVPVDLPTDVNDVAELAPQPNGQHMFTAALSAAQRVAGLEAASTPMTDCVVPNDSPPAPRVGQRC